MKISVLIPTRERLPLLRKAVASVLRLDDRDCEVVVSDNASSEDIGGWVRSLNDPRVVYVRTPEAIPVSDNWNNALAHSSGDYLIMLGDDDALLGRYFQRVRSVIGRFDGPQVVYHNALVYAYPGVLPEEPNGYLRSEGYAPFLRRAGEPFRLPASEARELVRAAMRFRVRYGFNMQFVTVARSAIEALSEHGPFYRSPFPDYYAMNHLFERCSEIVADPQPSVVIGVSPRSYGFFHSNRDEAAGGDFLQAGRADVSGPRGGELLPGTNINNGWLRAMEELEGELGPGAPRPDYRRYRRLQILYVYEGHHLRRTVSAPELAELRALMSHGERTVYDLAFKGLALLARAAPKLIGARLPSALGLLQRQFPIWDPVRDEREFADVEEVLEQVDPAGDPERWQRQRSIGPLGSLARRLG